MQPASAQATTSEEAAAIATLRPRAIGPGERCRLQLSSRIGTSVGYFARAASRRSQVPSVEPPSTMMTSAGARVWCIRLSTSESMSSLSLRTVDATLTDGMFSGTPSWLFSFAEISVPAKNSSQFSVTAPALPLRTGNWELLPVSALHVRAVDAKAAFFVLCVYTGKEVVG